MKCIFVCYVSVFFFFILLLLSSGFQAEIIPPECQLVISPNFGDIVVRVGSSGTITCAVPQACKLSAYSVAWINSDGIYLHPGSVRISAVSVNITVVNLNYFQILSSDMGYYTCLSRVGDFSVQASIRLTAELNIVKEIPVTTSKPGTEKPS
ncbi:uncharacterized protein LOC106874629 [Octopus bimaculoides]|uniref:uncharacterized protein LOC106874629 n=1 Tax=Octopus bimaculoides TaxID=37653 RepID=UPI00071CACE7|nr:uncharacterized protein LOC106874629 [Octopus bimaculoides]|eukprot:XP_014777911.1 PREDICTED: uncharacterized protein LOC106874629 [Octopus bimaculoides]